MNDGNDECICLRLKNHQGTGVVRDSLLFIHYAVDPFHEPILAMGGMLCIV